MILNLRSQGDPSVGIWPLNVEIKIDGFELEDDDRDDWCNYFKEIFGEYLDDKFTDAWFDDECPECHKRLDKNGECSYCREYYKSMEYMDPKIQ